MMEAIQATIQCDKVLYDRIATHLHLSISGKPVFYTDSLTDLVRRHCPDIYEMAAEAGFKFLPSTDPKQLEQRPPDLRFAIVRR